MSIISRFTLRVGWSVTDMPFNIVALHLVPLIISPQERLPVPNINHQAQQQ